MFTIANIRPFGHNIGNSAINLAIRYLLYEAFGRLVSVIDYPASSRHESTSIGGITASTIFEINRFADGVIIGGGNLYENNEIDVDRQALLALQPPLMLFSNSRGRIYNRNGQFADRSDVIPDTKLMALLERADLSLSRDSTTHAYLSNINPKDELGWCPTINLSRWDVVLPKLPANEEVGALISVRTPQLMNVPYRYQSEVQSHVNLAIDTLRAIGHSRIRILCNDSRDLDFASAFRYTKGVDSLYTSDVYQYLSLLKHADILVSYRLHATLPAVSYGTPVVNIVYDERSKSLCSDLGLSSSSIAMVELGSEFEAILENAIRNHSLLAAEQASLEPNWSEIRHLQLEALSRFQELVREYVELGRRRE